MGSGASSPVEDARSPGTVVISQQEYDKLRSENQRLRSRNERLEAQLSKSSSTQDDRSKLTPESAGKSFARRSSSTLASGGRRREAVSAEVRELKDITSSYEKRKGSPKSKDISAILSRAVGKSLLFNSLGQEDKADCVDAFTKVEHNAGFKVISQGDVGDAFYVISSGKLEVKVKSQTGTIESKGFLEAGDSFGELALLYNQARAATIVTITPVTLWSLSRDAFVTISTFHKSQRTRKKVQYLKKVEIFKSLYERQLASAAEALECEYHSAGETIILQGEKGKHFYLIEEGTVRYEKREGDGNADIVGKDGPGGYFGERALIDDTDTRSASVIAETNVSIWSMDRSMFCQLVEGHRGKLLAMRKKSLVREASKVGQKFKKNINLSDLIILRTLGEGAFGRVRLVKHKKTNALYALKYLAKQNVIDNGSQEHVQNEMTIMMMIDSTFVLKLYNTMQDKRYLYFLVELVRGGELFTLLRGKGSLPDKDARFYAAGIVEAFKHMHALCITYRDLKPENLLITRDGYIKLIDFGLAKVVAQRTYTLCGTPEYLAPEVIVNMGHDRAVDYWALGVLIFEMVTGLCPFEGEDSMATYNLILQGQISFPSTPKVPLACKSIISLFCQTKPQRRLGYLKIGDIFSHHWFVGFDWNAFSSKELSAPFTPKVTNDDDLSNFDHYEEIDDATFPECSWSPDGFDLVN